MLNKNDADCETVDLNTWEVTKKRGTTVIYL